MVVLLATGAVGCGRGAVSIEQEAEVLARTCASLQLRSAGRVVEEVDPEVFAEALAREPGGERDRLVAQVLKDRCRPPDPTPTTVAFPGQGS